MFSLRLGERVHLLLKKHGRSQKELADFLNTKTSTINGWKQSNRNPSSDMIVPICEFFNISTDYLLRGKDESIYSEVHNSASDFFSEEKPEKYIAKPHMQSNSLTEEQIRLLNYFDQLNEFEKNIIIGKISEMIHCKKTGQGTSSEFSEELAPDISHNINLLDRVNK